MGQNTQRTDSQIYKVVKNFHFVRPNIINMHTKIIWEDSKFYCFAGDSADGFVTTYIPCWFKPLTIRMSHIILPEKLCEDTRWIVIIAAGDVSEF